MVLMIYCLTVLVLWALMAVLVGWWLTREGSTLLADPPPPVRDPIVELVDKWAHDWERGRA